MQRNKRKTTEWERLAISLRKSEIPREHFRHNKGQKQQEQKQKILRRGGKNTQKNCTKKIFTTQIITMV